MYSAEKKADGHDKLEYVSSRKVTIEEDGINVKNKCRCTIHEIIVRCDELT